LPPFHERLETHEVDRFLEALAELRFDARVEIVGSRRSEVPKNELGVIVSGSQC